MKIQRFPVLAMTATVVLFSASACHRSARSQTKSAAPATLPRVPQMSLALGRITEGSADLQRILLSSAVKGATGASVVFSIDAAENKTQMLGYTINEQLSNFSGEAQLHDGSRITCAETRKETKSASEADAEHFVMQCGTRTIRFDLKSAASADSSFAADTLNRSIVQGAHLFLHSDSKDKDVIEFVLKGQTALLTVFSETDESIRTAELSQSEVGNFLSSKSPIRFDCQAAHCGNGSGTILLTRKENGELMATQEIYLRQSGAPSTKVFRRSGQEGLRVATYNVENFWDDVPENSKAYDDYSAELSDWYSERFAEKKAKRIGDALLAAGLPDVVGFQEIESAGNQSRSLEILKPVLAPLGYNYYALGLQADDNPTAVTTAVISKFPLLENTRLDFLFDSAELMDNQRADFISASRDPQRVTVGLPEGTSLTILNSHWKSKRDKSPVGDAMRESLASLMREHLQQLRQNHTQPLSAIIMGDFNADYREKPVQEGLQLAKTLSAARQLSTSLFDLWQTRDSSGQGDYPHDTKMTAIDNLIVTQPMLTENTIVLSRPLQVVGEFGLAGKLLRNGDLLPLRSQQLQVKGNDGLIHTFHRDAGYSDHLPLVAEFSRSLSSSRTISATRFADPVEQHDGSLLPLREVPNAACVPEETRTMTAAEISRTLMAGQRGDCVQINANLLLRKTGLYNIAFDLPAESQLSPSQRIVIISADRSFGVNKDWLRNKLQKSEGQTVLSLRGRLGLIDGVKAIFISSPDTDIKFQ